MCTEHPEMSVFALCFRGAAAGSSIRARLHGAHHETEDVTACIWRAGAGRSVRDARGVPPGVRLRGRVQVRAREVQHRSEPWVCVQPLRPRGRLNLIRLCNNQDAWRRLHIVSIHHEVGIPSDFVCALFIVCRANTSGCIAGLTRSAKTQPHWRCCRTCFGSLTRCAPVLMHAEPHAITPECGPALVAVHTDSCCSQCSWQSDQNVRCINGVPGFMTLGGRDIHPAVQMSPRARLTALIEGSLAANIFDWGAAACVELYHNGGAAAAAAAAAAENLQSATPC